ncbi:MAG: hypothetical protein A3H37_04400 [Candidatus Schekmanbacteria bacterium RIFCSPLOWO2_02_FULL_38_14]|uniref:Methyltransferase type 11 domain-containing protein n=1 Tax=Candidatus Schekmanbacteria bacterium RIFCSPLOWO2_12_FULL_38_15 TaxID=1817883 RepID=A0A1F7SME1_9BACT|nr:MAG: hypothetical protein A3H37_04400 [Candidatus Schekmanbacteria bacterium RIFCSPLOWO2_02_FULL_38_14]OGL54398.1 MAG: hypothetical protein A3G31_12205 [Candidatus Schekmanbacteria bacterium RIFCSPLOWO2_12_FULL_38_15]
MKKDYISIVYDKEKIPKTDYPFKLALHLINKFNLRKEDKLLEIGCGRGDFLEAFRHFGVDVYGVDLCDSSVKTLCHLGVKKVDISKDTLPFDDNSIDIIYHKSLLEHFYSPEHLMKETYRVLKPDGRVIILTPDWISQMKIFYEDFTHCRPYDTTAVGDLLRISGFSEIQTGLFYQLPILWEFPVLKVFSFLLQLLISTPNARKLTKLTGIKFFRWSVELMVLGTGIKDGKDA